MGFVHAMTVVSTKTTQKNFYTNRLLYISSTKNLKHMQGTAEIAALSEACTAKTSEIRSKLGENPSSDEYMANMQEVQSAENEYNILITDANNRMKTAEDNLEQFRLIVQTQLDVVTKEQEQWKELAKSEAEKFGYFKT